MTSQHSGKTDITYLEFSAAPSSRTTQVFRTNRKGALSKIIFLRNSDCYSNRVKLCQIGKNPRTNRWVYGECVQISHELRSIPRLVKLFALEGAAILIYMCGADDGNPRPGVYIRIQHPSGKIEATADAPFNYSDAAPWYDVTSKEILVPVGGLNVRSKERNKDLEGTDGDLPEREANFKPFVLRPSLRRFNPRTLEEVRPDIKLTGELLEPSVLRTSARSYAVFDATQNRLFLYNRETLQQVTELTDISHRLEDTFNFDSQGRLFVQHNCARMHTVSVVESTGAMYLSDIEIQRVASERNNVLRFCSDAQQKKLFAMEYSRDTTRWCIYETNLLVKRIITNIDKVENIITSQNKETILNTTFKY